MKKSPVVISLILICLGIISFFYVSAIPNNEINMKDKVSFYLSIVSCVGALVSAAFVVFTYISTSRAYVESQRPQLLLFLHNGLDDNGKLLSILQYKNITSNKFTDLTIDLKVSAFNREYSLSELFRSKMTMIGGDERQRAFDHESELKSLGLELSTVSKQGHEITIDVSYSYSFNGSIETEHAQFYRWCIARSEWEIA